MVRAVGVWESIMLITRIVAVEHMSILVVTRP